MPDLLTSSELRDVRPCFILDARGKLCPEPIKLTSKKIKELGWGEVLEVLADDEASLKDFPSWARVTGQEYLGHLEDGALESRNPHSCVVRRFFVRQAKRK